MIFKRNKKNAAHKAEAKAAIQKNDLASRKGIWTPSLDDRRRLVIQDMYLTALSMGVETVDQKIFSAAVMRNSLIPLESDFNEETRLRAENDMQSLSILTSRHIVKMMEGGH